MTEEDMNQNNGTRDKAAQDSITQGNTNQKSTTQKSTNETTNQATQQATAQQAATQPNVEPPDKRTTPSTRKTASRSAKKPTASSKSGSPSAELILPDEFHFGVATAGFQVEGGFNGPGEPANNWLWWEMAGKVEPSGIAVNFWNRYEEMLDLVAAMGCDAFRFGIEWARVEPHQGEIDTGALDRYVDIAKACKERGLEPLVTLHHFTHPSWLGEDFWLMPDAAVMFSKWVELAAGRLKEHVSNWVTINEMNVIAMGS